MKRKSIRVASMIIAIFLFAIMTACGGGDSQNSSAATTSKTADDISATAEETLEPVTITLMGGFDISGEGVQDDPVSKEITKLTGITIDVSNGNDDLKVTLAARIASNDLPDIWETLDKSQMYNAINAGLVIPLDDYLDEYGKNLTSDPTSKLRIAYSKKFCSPDGKLYAIRSSSGGETNPYLPIESHYIRWDIYNKIGRPEIKTMDDLLNVLAEMQKAYPQNSEGKKVYAMAFWFGEHQEWGDWQFSIDFAEGYEHPGSAVGYCYGSYNVLTRDFDGGCPVTDKDSVYYQHYIQWFNKAYRMGLMDPDSFTMKNDQYQNNVKAGRYLYVNASWDGNKQIDNVTDNGFVVLPPLDTDKMVVKYLNVAGERSFFISKSCKNPERALQLLDFATSTQGNRLITSGIEGVHYNVVDGKLKMSDEMIAKYKDSNYMLSTGIGKYRAIVGVFGGVNLQDGQAAFLWQGPDFIASTMPAFRKEAAEFFGFPDANGSHPSLKCNYYDGIYRNAFPELTADMKKIDADVTNYMFKSLLKAIRSNTEEEYQKNVEEMAAMAKQLKADEVFNFRKTALVSMKKELEPLIQEVYGQ